MIHFYVHADSSNNTAVKAKTALEQKYADRVVCDVDKSDVIISLGGDGTTLDALRLGLEHNKKVYGMNLGHVGAYQNQFNTDHLPERIADADEIKLNPLIVHAQKLDDSMLQAYAWNEIYIRSGDNPQQARLIGYIDQNKHPFNINGDGYLLASPMGSLAYNLAAGGHKLHFRENLLASTAIAASFGVRDILSDHSKIHIEVQDPVKRCVSLVTDNRWLGKIKSCYMYQDTHQAATLLWDKDKTNAAEERGRKILLTRQHHIIQELKTNGYFLERYHRY